MQRISKDNLKKFGRRIGKVSQSNPWVLLSSILGKVQVYDNFIAPVVDSLRYMTGLAYDILAYSIIEAFSNPGKNRLKKEDTNLSSWLTALATFNGHIYRKYDIDMEGILQYIANKVSLVATPLVLVRRGLWRLLDDMPSPSASSIVSSQLKAEESADLVVLKELILQMTGMENTENVTEEQLEALSGGPLLRKEAGSFITVRVCSPANAFGWAVRPMASHSLLTSSSGAC